PTLPVPVDELRALPQVAILANKGARQSPLEVLGQEGLRNILERYSKDYDYIFLEAAALDQYADAYELEPFADKVLGVFHARNSLLKSDQEGLLFLRRLGDKYLGSVLNGVE
ncbi:MAG: hypothetical protein D6765_03090, partial [Bacteroidetes bacterium]